jgi:tRNA(fMet)-specific endonuclease VapC
MNKEANAMVFVDSDLLINSLKDLTSKNKAVNEIRKRAKDFLEQLFNKHPIVKTTVYNLVELYTGAFQSKKVAKNLQIIELFLEQFDVVYPVLKSAKENARLTADLEIRGTPVGFSDLWIGSIVVSEGDILYTRNLGHFEKIPGLKLVDWSKPIKA